MKSSHTVSFPAFFLMTGKRNENRDVPVCWTWCNWGIRRKHHALHGFHNKCNGHMLSPKVTFQYLRDRKSVGHGGSSLFHFGNKPLLCFFLSYYIFKKHQPIFNILLLLLLLRFLRHSPYRSGYLARRMLSIRGLGGCTIPLRGRVLLHRFCISWLLRPILVEDQSWMFFGIMLNWDNLPKGLIPGMIGTLIPSLCTLSTNSKYLRLS